MNNAPAKQAFNLINHKNRSNLIKLFKQAIRNFSTLGESFWNSYRIQSNSSILPEELEIIKQAKTEKKLLVNFAL